MPPFLAAVADDDTGATDLAGMLTAHGMRVVLVLEGATQQELAGWSSEADAVILGTASRSVAPGEAYTRVHGAFTMLKTLGPQRYLLKYCSTFDSTARGNIGQSIDAACDALQHPFTIAVPALPELGRTTYMGYHFVGRQLLSDSSLRQHPLNPMTNPHLPSHLSTQTQRPIDLLTHSEIRQGADAVRGRLKELSQQSGIVILDCLDNDDLRTLAEATWQLSLLTGSSALGSAWPPVWREHGVWHSSADAACALHRLNEGQGYLIVSGSCSITTQRQNEWAAHHGIMPFPLRPLQLLTSSDVDEATANITVPLSKALAAGETCLLTTTGTCSVEQVHSAAAEQGLTPVQAGERVASALATATRNVLRNVTPAGMIFAGGETSSTLMRALNLGGLRVGPNIEPGVPVCVALRRPGLGIVLKSGNFGSDDFHGRALHALRALPLRSTAHEEFRS